MATQPAGIQPAIAELPDLEAKRAHAEWPFEVGLVPLRVLIVDDTYQRPPHHEFVSREAERFDPTLIGTIDVSKRKNGDYAILDGQQRYLIMQIVGKTACYCSIYTGLTIAEEAGFFYKKNKDRNTMKPFYSFRARRVAGDPEAIEINDIVEAEGFAFGPTSNEDNVIGAVTASEKVFAMGSEHRDQQLSITLYTIREAFKGRKDCFNNSLIQGMGKFWQSYSDDEVNIDKLVQALQEVGPTGVLGLARDSMALAPKGRLGTQSLPRWVAHHVGSLYNKQLSVGAGKGAPGVRKQKLDLKRTGLA